MRRGVAPARIMARGYSERSVVCVGLFRHSPSGPTFANAFVFPTLQGVCVRCGKKGHTRKECTARIFECEDVCTNCGAIGMHKTPKCPHPPLPPSTLVLEGTRKEWVIPPNGRLKLNMKCQRDGAVNVDCMYKNTFEALLHVYRAIPGLSACMQATPVRPLYCSRRARRRTRGGAWWLVHSCVRGVVKV